MNSPAKPKRKRSTVTGTITEALKSQRCTPDEVLKSPGAYYRLEGQRLLDGLSSAGQLDQFARRLHRANQTDQPQQSKLRLARWIRRTLPEYADCGDDRLMGFIEAHQFTARTALEGRTSKTTSRGKNA